VDLQPFIDENRALWNEWTDVHVVGEFYNRDGFVRDPSDIRLRPEEIAELGDVTGKSLLHLQCHFGLDSLSWARLGARVTGADFSERAIEEATKLAGECGIEARFVTSDLYDLPAELEGSFDIVYTGVGALGWLPDIGRWAEVVAHFLKPGGTFYVLEGHPSFWIFDGEAETPLVKYPYFQREDPITEKVEGSYADPTADIQTEHEHGWAFGLGEVVNALIEQGLTIRSLREYDFLLWPATFLEEGPDGRWRMPAGSEAEIPLMFSIKATK
jgi:SAM-dependent methyltransferase